MKIIILIYEVKYLLSLNIYFFFLTHILQCFFLIQYSQLL